jgi:hypothetical protein
MNERIKELAEQAGLGIIFHLEDMGVDGEAELWKFAELIVEKCADVAKYHTPDTEECEHTWLIHDKIKEHFGVVE